MPGRHLLSLCGESRQRRTKERKDNRSERFSEGNLLPFISLESLLSFDRSRFATVAEAPVSHVCESVKVVPAALGQLQFETLTSREPVLEFDCVRFLADRTAAIPPGVARTLERIYKYERIH